MNDALAAVQPDGTGAASRWGSYRRRWTAWNHVSVIASLGAAGLLAVALPLG